MNAQTLDSVVIPAFSRGLDQWPRSWMGIEHFLPPGEQRLRTFAGS